MKPIRASALKALNEYFKWFSGDTIQYEDKDLVQFEPSYDGGKVEFKNYGIIDAVKEHGSRLIYMFNSGSGVNIQGKTISGSNNKDYLSHRQDTVKNTQPEHGTDEGKDYVPRVGYKVQYKIEG